jgi:CubicO group peptidase (beta-lactamase class C family)
VVTGQELGHDAPELRRRAHELLSRPPYREAEEGPLGAAWRAAREWLAEQIGTLLSLLGGDPGVAWLLVGIGVLLLGTVVWRATRGLTLDRAVEAPATGPGGRPASSWHADADEHEVAGRWSDAVRCRYRALVGQLVEAGVIEDVPGRTVGELDRELVATAPGMAEDVAAAGVVFARIFYGREPAQASDARTVAEVASRTGAPEVRW